jgi:hypothetical protein
VLILLLLLLPVLSLLLLVLWMQPLSRVLPGQAMC